MQLTNGDDLILEITEDWDNEDLYSYVQERTNETSWELQGGLVPATIPCNNVKVFKGGYGGIPIQQVRKSLVYSITNIT